MAIGPAYEKLQEFRRTWEGGGQFKYITKQEVADGIAERLNDWTKINQLTSSLCGPTALVTSVLRDNPVMYVNYVLDLYKVGKGRIGSIDVKPGTDCKNYRVDPTAIPPVDWIALASIRDSENDWFDYQSPSDEAGGITMPGDLADWFKKAGYAEVVDNTNIWFTKNEESLRNAGKWFAAGYYVHMLVNAEVLWEHSYSHGSAIPDHWIGLRSVPAFTGDRVNFKVYSWGRERDVREAGSLRVKDFLDDYYGYIAVKRLL